MSAIAPHPSPTLRPAGPADREFLYRVYASTREEELAPLAWSNEQKEQFLRMQFEAQDAHYKQHYAVASFDLIELEDEPIGRLYVDRWADEIRVIDIALLPEHRGAGTGTRLLEELVAEAAESGKRLSIHVERHNSARRLYERLGFEPVAEHGVYLLLEASPERVER